MCYFLIFKLISCSYEPPFLGVLYDMMFLKETKCEYIVQSVWITDISVLFEKEFKKMYWKPNLMSMKSIPHQSKKKPFCLLDN